MKFTVYIKDPDSFGDAAKDAVKHELKSTLGLSDDEREMLAESRAETLGEFMGKWVEYGECVTLEFDTDAGTASVLPRKP